MPITLPCETERSVIKPSPTPSTTRSNAPDEACSMLPCELRQISLRFDPSIITSPESQQGNMPPGTDKVSLAVASSTTSRTRPASRHGQMTAFPQHRHDPNATYPVGSGSREKLVSPHITDRKSWSSSLTSMPQSLEHQLRAKGQTEPTSPRAESRTNIKLDPIDRPLTSPLWNQHRPQEARNTAIEQAPPMPARASTESHKGNNISIPPRRTINRSLQFYRRAKARNITDEPRIEIQVKQKHHKWTAELMSRSTTSTTAARNETIPNQYQQI